MKGRVRHGDRSRDVRLRKKKAADKPNLAVVEKQACTSAADYLFGVNPIQDGLHS